MNKFNQGQFASWDDLAEGNEIALLTEEEVADVAGACTIRKCWKKCKWGVCITLCANVTI